MDEQTKNVLQSLIDEYGIGILEDTDRLAQFLEDRCADGFDSNFKITFALRELVKFGWSPKIKISEKNYSTYSNLLVKNLGFNASAAKDVMDMLRDITDCTKGPESEEQEDDSDNAIVATRGNLRRIAGGISNKPRTMWIREKSLRNGLILLVSLLCIVVLFFQMSGQRTPIGDEFRIAFFTRLTGRDSQLGLNQLRAAQLAVEDINKRGGVRGYKLKIVGFDLPADRAGAEGNLRKIMDDKSILAMISGVGGGVGQAISTVADEINVPLIVTAPDARGAAEEGRTFLYSFYLSASAEDRAKMLAYFAIQGIAKKKAAVLYDRDNEPAMLEHGCVLKWVKGFGGEIVSDISFSGKNEDNYSVAAAVVKESGANLLILPGGSSKTAKIITDVRSGGFEGVILGYGYSDVIAEKAGDAMTGSWWINEVSPLDPQIRSMLKNFRSLYNENCPENDVRAAVLAYDGVMWAANALYKAPGYRGEAIRHALLATKNFPMTHATLTIDPRSHGPFNKAMALIFCENKKGIFQKRIRISKVE